jgi:hypothetical protein
MVRVAATVHSGCPIRLNYMAKTMDTVVRDMLGQQQLTIAALQIQVEELQEQLAAAQKVPEKKSPLHEVKQG